MAEGARDARPVQVTEAELVSDFAESMQLHGWKVTTYKVTVDREAGTTALSINSIKGAPEQGVLPLRGRKKKGEEPGAEEGGED